MSTSHSVALQAQKTVHDDALYINALDLFQISVSAQFQECEGSGLYRLQSCCKSSHGKHHHGKIMQKYAVMKKTIDNCVFLICLARCLFRQSQLHTER